MIFKTIVAFSDNGAKNLLHYFGKCTGRTSNNRVRIPPISFSNGKQIWETIESQNNYTNSDLLVLARKNQIKDDGN